MSIMKAVIMIISILGFITLYSCTKKVDVNKLLDNAETRSDIFEAIANDHYQMTAFMEALENKDYSVQMMQKNHLIIGNMMKGEGLHTMMKDSMMMHILMTNIMKNEKIISDILQMMSNKEMMGN